MDAYFCGELNKFIQVEENYAIIEKINKYIVPAKPARTLEYSVQQLESNRM